MKNRLAEYIQQVSIIKHYINLNDKQEVEIRSRHLKSAGLKPPHTQKQCTQMIKDLKRWYL